VDVVSKGILGDRAYALWDLETERIASAKNPKKWAKLLGFHAEFVSSPKSQTSMPAVKFALPDGSTTTSDNIDINTNPSCYLSKTVSKQVKNSLSKC
jgi:hypothetical protein